MVTIWLTVSLSLSPGKKKRLKVNGNNNNELFCSLKDVIRQKLFKPHCNNEDIPEFGLVYKHETELESDATDLDDEDDFEGMLDLFPNGVGVRIFANTSDGKFFSYVL